MFKAVSRYFRAFFYLITGKIDSARKTLLSNTNVVAATYDQVIGEKESRVHQYKEMLASMMTQQARKEASINKEIQEIAKLEKLQNGATTKAKQILDRFSNKEEAKKDPEYIQCQASFRDFSSTLAEKRKNLAEMQSDLEAVTKNINQHKVSAKSLLYEVDKIKQEKVDAIGKIIAAKQDIETSNMASGISKDRSSKELQELRELVNETTAHAKVSREMAGIEQANIESDFASYAENSVADAEFDKLVSSSEKKESNLLPE